MRSSNVVDRDLVLGQRALARLTWVALLGRGALLGWNHLLGRRAGEPGARHDELMRLWCSWCHDVYAVFVDGVVSRFVADVWGAPHVLTFWSSWEFSTRRFTHHSRKAFVSLKVVDISEKYTVKCAMTRDNIRQAG